METPAGNEANCTNRRDYHSPTDMDAEMPNPGTSPLPPTKVPRILPRRTSPGVTQRAHFTVGCFEAAYELEG